MVPWSLAANLDRAQKHAAKVRRNLDLQLEKREREKVERHGLAVSAAWTTWRRGHQAAARLGDDWANGQCSLFAVGRWRDS